MQLFLFSVRIIFFFSIWKNLVKEDFTTVMLSDKRENYLKQAKELSVTTQRWLRRRLKMWNQSKGFTNLASAQLHPGQL